MVKRHSAAFYRLVGIIGTSRIVWRLAVAGYPGYAGHARRTHRRIPVVVLEPRSVAEAA